MLLLPLHNYFLFLELLHSDAVFTFSVNRLSRYAVESYLEQILSHGFFHADPVSCHIATVEHLHNTYSYIQKIV